MTAGLLVPLLAALLVVLGTCLSGTAADTFRNATAVATLQPLFCPRGMRALGAGGRSHPAFPSLSTSTQLHWNVVGLTAAASSAGPALVIELGDDSSNDVIDRRDEPTAARRTGDGALPLLPLKFPAVALERARGESAHLALGGGAPDAWRVRPTLPLAPFLLAVPHRLTQSAPEGEHEHLRALAAAAVAVQVPLWFSAAATMATTTSDPVDVEAAFSEPPQKKRAWDRTGDANAGLVLARAAVSVDQTNEDQLPDFSLETCDRVLRAVRDSVSAFVEKYTLTAPRRRLLAVVRRAHPAIARVLDAAADIGPPAHESNLGAWSAALSDLLVAIDDTKPPIDSARRRSPVTHVLEAETRWGGTEPHAKAAHAVLREMVENPRGGDIVRVWARARLVSGDIVTSSESLSLGHPCRVAHVRVQLSINGVVVADAETDRDDAQPLQLMASPSWSPVAIAQWKTYPSPSSSSSSSVSVPLLSWSASIASCDDLYGGGGDDCGRTWVNSAPSSHPLRHPTSSGGGAIARRRDRHRTSASDAAMPASNATPAPAAMPIMAPDESECDAEENDGAEHGRWDGRKVNGRNGHAGTSLAYGVVGALRVYRCRYESAGGAEREVGLQYVSWSVQVRE
ncbi:hypothetical protein BC828DRAFT_430529 [Blastocladiella britannica]|nr:hypothetical protein BC828DRAFT_430529 [Blastocladiella britannica]